MVKLIGTGSKYAKEYQALSSDVSDIENGVTPTQSLDRFLFEYPNEGGGMDADIIGNGATVLIVDAGSVLSFHDGDWYEL